MKDPISVFGGWTTARQQIRRQEGKTLGKRGQKGEPKGSGSGKKVRDQEALWSPTPKAWVKLEFSHRARLGH